jgi:hypothetical protein
MKPAGPLVIPTVYPEPVDECTHCTVVVDGIAAPVRLTVINCALKCLSCGETFLRSQLEPLQKV